MVIQVDADVAAEQKIDRAQPCPPPRANADEVHTLILEWLGAQALPAKVLLCVPSMASETWALVALLPAHVANVPCNPVPAAAGQCIECRRDIKALLRAQSASIGVKLVTLKQDKLKNHAPAYRKVQAQITHGWQAVVASCSEARRFDGELRAALPQ